MDNSPELHAVDRLFESGMRSLCDQPLHHDDWTVKRPEVTCFACIEVMPKAYPDGFDDKPLRAKPAPELKADNRWCKTCDKVMPSINFDKRNKWKCKVCMKNRYADFEFLFARLLKKNRVRLIMENRERMAMALKLQNHAAAQGYVTQMTKTGRWHYFMEIVGKREQVAA